ncbi:MAG: SMC-Scp complex subunit ScpB [Acidobacteriaceae bacterium]
MKIFEMKPYLEVMLMAADHPVTLEALAQSLEVTEQEIDAALQEFEADLLAADRSVQVRCRGRGVRLEMKPQFADRIGRLLPERKKLWRTTQLFLDTFGVASLEELYQAGRMEEVFAPVYSAELGEEFAKEGPLAPGPFLDGVNPTLLSPGAV